MSVAPGDGCPLAGSYRVDELNEHAINRIETKVDLDSDQLPTPVAKYFRRVLPKEPRRIKAARLLQTGEFRDYKTNRWGSFKAKEYFCNQPPSFVWEADIQMSKWITVHVRDSYQNGKASMQAKILSLVRVMNKQNEPELNSGALHRYLAECVWSPTALLPSKSIQWHAMDKNCAIATLNDSNAEVWLEFHFNDVGEVIQVYSPGRYREGNGKYELTPWRGHFSNYQEKNGIRIPIEGSAEWQLPEGNLLYWKGRILEVKYEFIG